MSEKKLFLGLTLIKYSLENKHTHNNEFIKDGCCFCEREKYTYLVDFHYIKPFNMCIECKKLCVKTYNLNVYTFWTKVYDFYLEDEKMKICNVFFNKNCIDCLILKKQRNGLLLYSIDRNNIIKTIRDKETLFVDSQISLMKLKLTKEQGNHSKLCWNLMEKGECFYCNQKDKIYAPFVHQYNICLNICKGCSTGMYMYTILDPESGDKMKCIGYYTPNCWNCNDLKVNRIKNSNQDS